MPDDINNAPCPICKSTAFDVLYTVTDTNQGVRGKWTLEQCHDCKLARINPFPDQNEIHTFYYNTFYTNDQKRFRPWMEKLRGIFGAIRGRHLRKLYPTPGTLLDYGSGAGHFGKTMSSYGWHVINIDPYSENQSYKTACELVDDTVKLKYPDNHFDVVSLWYVIEHLRNPREVIREIYRVLKPGGILLLAQQDFSSMQARIFRSNWLILDPPRHIFQFNPDNLGELARQESFVIHSVTHSSIEMGPYTILQSILNTLLFNNNALFRFLKHKKLNIKEQGIGQAEYLVTLAFSLILAVILGPVSLLLYFLLLAFRSGDIFTLYLRK